MRVVDPFSSKSVFFLEKVVHAPKRENSEKGLGSWNTGFCR
jgi:hypothetical protein